MLAHPRKAKEKAVEAISRQIKEEQQPITRASDDGTRPKTMPNQSTQQPTSDDMATMTETKIREQQERNLDKPSMFPSGNPGGSGGGGDGDPDDPGDRGPGRPMNDDERRLVQAL